MVAVSLLRRKQMIVYIYTFLFTQKAGPRDVDNDVSWAIGKFLYLYSCSFYLLAMFYRYPLRRKQMIVYLYSFLHKKQPKRC